MHSHIRNMCDLGFSLSLVFSLCLVILSTIYISKKLYSRTTYIFRHKKMPYSIYINSLHLYRRRFGIFIPFFVCSSFCSLCSLRVTISEVHHQKCIRERERWFTLHWISHTVWRVPSTVVHFRRRDTTCDVKPSTHAISQLLSVCAMYAACMKSLGVLHCMFTHMLCTENINSSLDKVSLLSIRRHDTKNSLEPRSYIARMKEGAIQLDTSKE